MSAQSDSAVQEVADQLDQISVGSSSIYSQNPVTVGRSRFNASQNQRPVQPPVAKLDLAFNKQQFAERPDTLVQDRKIGLKTELYTNHVSVHIPEQTVLVSRYNVEFIQRNRPIVKREKTAPLFWSFFAGNEGKFPRKSNFVYNDTNTIWTFEKFAKSTTKIDNRMGVWMIIKYTDDIEFGTTVHSRQDPQILATLLDAIATARVRDPVNRNVYTVFKKGTFLVEQDAHEDSLEGINLFTPLQWGVEGRVGFNLAFKMNLRAGITMCLDLSHTMFSRTRYPLIRLFLEVTHNTKFSDEEFEQRGDDNLDETDFSEVHKRMLKEILNGMKLFYSTGRGRAYKFDDFAKNAVEETFLLERENQPSVTISIAQFFHDQHNIILRHPKLPCVMLRLSRQRKIIVPMETLSYVAEPVRYEGFTPEEMTARMIQAANYTPTQQRQLLQHVFSQKDISRSAPIIKNTDEHMTKFGVQLDKGMLQVKASILPAPTVAYGNSTFHDTGNEGVWEAVREERIRTILPDGNRDRKTGKKKVVIGCIVRIDTPNSGVNDMQFDTACYNRLMLALEEAGQPIYYSDAKNRLPALLDSRYFKQDSENPLNLREYLREVKEHVESHEQYKHDEFVVVPLVFLLFRARCSNFAHGNTINMYNLMKHFGDNLQGVYTQGILINNFNAITTRTTCMLTCHLVEKILGKIGTTHRKLERNKIHVPWKMLTDPQEPTLVLGIDVSHPKPADLKAGGICSLSVATVVGNIDIDVTQFRASSRIQDTGEERICRMEMQIQDRIADFNKNTNLRPEHIVVYRDGISEGDFQKYLYEEKIAIETACCQIDPEYKPKITYIVVSKRHHTKFFPVSADGMNATGNVKPGTLIEDTVTTKKYYDFFLSTQLCEMGTARPTHYYVLYDTWHPTISFWPTVTHALAYTFCRTTTTINVPSPVMYAHLAAKRAKEALYGADVLRCITNANRQASSYEIIAQLNKAVQTHADLDGITFV